MVQACISLLQYPLLALTLGPGGGDFTYVNAAFVGVAVAQSVVIAALGRRLGEGGLRVRRYLRARSRTPSTYSSSSSIQQITQCSVCSCSV